MKFQLENLPRTVLLEVISYVDPEELLDIRFLNKNLFSIVGCIIKDHLKYLTYNRSPIFKTVQEDFVKRYSSLMMHFCINLFEIYVNPNNNITKIVYDNGFNSIKSLCLNSERSFFDDEDFNFARKILYKVEKIVLNLPSGDTVDRFLLFLNPEKLRSLHILSELSILFINNILEFLKFKKLEELKVCAYKLKIKYDNLVDSDTVIFPSLKNLEIEIKSYLDMDFGVFSNADQLKNITIGIPDYSTNVLNFILGKSSLAKIFIKYNCTASLNLSTFFTQLNQILTVGNDISLTISHIDYLDKVSFLIDVPTFFCVKEIVFDFCGIRDSHLNNFLNHFPKVRKVRIHNSKIHNYTNEDIILPNNSNCLLIIDKESLNKYQSLTLLNAINTYSY